MEVGGQSGVSVDGSRRLPVCEHGNQGGQHAYLGGRAGRLHEVDEEGLPIRAVQDITEEPGDQCHPFPALLAARLQ